MAKYNLQIREEELKNKVAADFFEQFDTTQMSFSLILLMFINSIVLLIDIVDVY